MAQRTKKRTLTKQGLLTEIAVGGTGRRLDKDAQLTQRQVEIALSRLAQIGQHELVTHGSFTIPGVAKFVTVRKRARPARVGINPFTGQKQKFKAKPASKTVRARPVSSFKASVAKR